MLTNLRNLRLFCYLFGSIPVELSRLIHLEKFEIRSTLTGTIPSKFAAITSLTYLDLLYLKLIGTIPSKLSTLTSLKYLTFSNN
jgi:Leucine-rich repeat (LRR) protein